MHTHAVVGVLELRLGRDSKTLFLAICKLLGNIGFSLTSKRKI